MDILFFIYTLGLKRWLRDSSFIHKRSAFWLMSQPTLRQDDKGKIDKSKRPSPRVKTSEVVTNVYSRKTLEKTKRGLRILKIRVCELFMHREGISTPRARHKAQKPLIECVKTWLQYYLFSLFIFFIFWDRQGGCPCSYVSSGAMRNSDLRSSLIWMFVC